MCIMGGEVSLWGSVSIVERHILQFPMIFNFERDTKTDIEITPPSTTTGPIRTQVACRSH